MREALASFVPSNSRPKRALWAFHTLLCSPEDEEEEDGGDADLKRLDEKLVEVEVGGEDESNELNELLDGRRVAV